MSPFSAIGSIFTSSSTGSITWGSVASAAIGAYFTHSLSVRLGPVRLTASDVGGKPARLTPDAITAVGRKLLSDITSGKPLAQERFQVQVGDIVVDVSPWSGP